MQTHNSKNAKSSKRWLASLTTWLLLIALLMQSLPLTVAAAFMPAAKPGIAGNSNGIINGISSSIGNLESDEAIAQLKKDLINSLNTDLVKKIEDQELKGAVGVILSFSDNSLVTAYNKSSSKQTLGEYLDSYAAQQLKDQLEENQTAVLDKLLELGLITDVKYNYYNVMDGAFVSTTYEQIEELSKVEGVERIIISNTYKPAVAVENPVYVYDTGIFDSSNIDFTGKGTIVAILDTGCDYTHSAFITHDVVDPLYDRDDIAALLDKTKAYGYDTSLEVREVYYGNITKNKIAFGYDYADKDPDIMPYNNEHGTHVAGIIGGYDDVITGVAIDTQFAIMKVFSDYEQGAEDGDILAALEDSIILGVDAINMSLGSSCGFSREVDDEYKNDVYDRIEQAGISLVVAASNDYSSAFGSEAGNTNKTDNPDSATVGSPATYHSSLAVASINGNKDKYMYANGDREVFYHDSVNMAAKEYDFFAMLGINAENPVREFEYVTIPGVGMAINYAGLDMSGKIALVKRGDISFEEKIQFAYEAGAVAVIVYNNVFGDIIMTVGNDAKIPAVSIGKDDGEVLAAQETGVIKFDLYNQAGPFMSDFSSWGPTPNLELKPEITAHGGNIWSAVLGGEYEKMSGTSMASPNMCGIVVLIRQYVKEKYPDMTAEEVRDLVNQLCMSTATIALDRKGNPYSPRKQGAGIADISKATTTPAYLYVDGIGKTKLELGDDPTRSGVYKMSINLKNISDQTVSYRLGNIAMTESLSTSDPEYVAEMGYLLSHASDYQVTGDGTLANGVVSVPAGKTATITLTITLSAQDKAYLNESFENGMYIEGFMTFDNTDEKGIDLNAPFLAFFGDWADAPIFDLDYYEVETEAHNDAIDDDDKIKADYYATTPLGTYYYDYIVPMGGYLYKMDEEEYSPISATQDKAAVSYYADSISGIYGVLTGLLRGAKELDIKITNVATGEVVWSETQYNCYKAHYAGAPRGYFADIRLPMVDTENGEVFGYNNTKYEVTMSAKLDWDGETRNSKDSYSFSFYIDYEAPIINNAVFRTEYDKARKENRYYVDLMVYDNHYAQSIRPVIVYDIMEDGEMKKTYSSLCEYPIPIYQENRGESTKVTVEITDYIDTLRNSKLPEGITFYIDDYALNGSVCFVPFPETENAELEFVVPELDLAIGQTADLTTYLALSDNSELEPIYFENLTWSSSDESVVAINNGHIEAKKSGTATISVTGRAWTYKDGEEVKQLYKQIPITVSEETVEDPNSSMNTQIEELKFSHYYTLFAFNSDIDYSEIGLTDTTHFFGESASITFYPSEKVQLYYSLDPWNIDPSRYKLKWSSSNPKVATVDENGIVTAQAEGKTRITLQIEIDGKMSLLAARCSVEVKSEFIIENRQLIAYKGWGGDVVIPDDEGIMYIGSYAFCHFDLDNEKEVEKDEDGNYDFDDKKEPLGNDTLTSVVIPEGVEYVEKYAFYNCNKLSNVTLPESCKTINSYAFAKCELLENINFDKVQIIADYAFYQCDSLTGEDIGGINLSHVSTIGDHAFEGCRLTNIDLSNLRRSGKSAFANCQKLESVILGSRTRIAEDMFQNTAIQEIVIYSDIIGDGAFEGCEKLTSVKLSNDLTYLGREAFSGCKKLTTVTFEGVCEEIAALAFYNCAALEEITLPDSEVILREGAFANCKKLKTVAFGKNTLLKTVGVGVFESDMSASIKLTDSVNYKFVDGVLYTKDGTTLVLIMPGANVGKTFEVPASVKHIGAGAFASNNSLTNLTFESGSQLESIGECAFSGCTLLTAVQLPDRPVTIGESAFYNSTLLKVMNLDKVTSIGDFAFEHTSLSSISLLADNVVVGQGAFSDCGYLRTVTLGKGASIGAYAFKSTPVTAVILEGEGVTIGEGAFYECKGLATLDFTKVTGKIGNYAFYLCRSLSEVNMPNVTEIGEGAFADCYALATLRADNLEVIGKMAFAPTLENVASGAVFSTVYMPKLRVIGDHAFYGCIYLTEMDLTNVTDIGMYAFAICSALETITGMTKVTKMSEFTFYGCTELQLNEDSLANIVRFDMGAFYGVPLPKKLNLNSAEYIGSQAFIELENANTLEEVYAPNLINLGDQAFISCVNLKKLVAPKLETIEFASLAFTSIEEFEVSPALKSIEYSVFEGTDTLKAFYVMKDGNKVYDFENENIMIKDGVLYTVTDKGYVLSVYPAAKADKEYTVADGTIRIEYTAAMASKNLEKIVMPESLSYIGNFAFFGCDNLKTVVFKSYYAPTLEGTLTGASVKITPDNVSDYPGFDKLYFYDYYFRDESLKEGPEVGRPFYYSNFIDVVTSAAANNLTYVIPDTCEGYDSVLYKAYFNPSEETSGAVTHGSFALAFIEAALKLPEVADRFDKALIDAAINAYNALEGHADELASVDVKLIEHFRKVRAEYNVSVVENKIARLFDMAKNEFSFERLKEARASYLALTADEQARVSNAAVIDTKVAELAAAMGVEEIDFTKTFAENLPVTPPPPPPPPPPVVDNTLKIVLIVTGSAIAVAAIAVAILVFLKKKRTVQ